MGFSQIRIFPADRTQKHGLLLDILDDHAIADSTGMSIAQVQQIKKRAGLNSFFVSKAEK